MLCLSSVFASRIVINLRRAARSPSISTTGIDGAGHGGGGASSNGNANVSNGGSSGSGTMVFIQPYSDTMELPSKITVKGGRKPRTYYSEYNRGTWDDIESNAEEIEMHGQPGWR